MSAARGEYSRAAKQKLPAYVKVNRFAVFQLGRDLGLKSLDRFVLQTFAMLCDYKNGDYFTTLAELAEDTGADWRALDASVKRLESEGLIQIVVPFRQKSQGQVRVLALDQLVVDAKPVHRALPPEPKIPHLLAAKRKPAKPQDSTEGTNPAAIPRENDSNPARKPRKRNIAPAPTCDDANTHKGAGEEGSKGCTNEAREDAQVIAQLQRALGGELVE